MNAYGQLSEILRDVRHDEATLLIDGAPHGRLEISEIQTACGHLHLDDLDVAFRIDRISDVTGTTTAIAFTHHRADGRDERIELRAL